MRWLMAALHVGRHREMVAGGPLPAHEVPDVVDIECPLCGMVYVADLTSGQDSPDLEAQCWAAEEMLREACPDHEVRMVVE
jgi:hypothetical protein